MKSALQLHLGHQLTLTPQLQMAIRLLQLSTTELQQEIQQLLETNSMLEFSEEETDMEEPVASADTAPVTELTEINLQESETINTELPIDTNWDEVYQEPMALNAQSDLQNLEWQLKKTVSLHEHLLWQMELTPFTPTEKAIAMSIIDSINEDGMLEASLVELQHTFPEECRPEITDIENVLAKIQDFDPLGVGARDLRECLLIQLQQKPANTPLLTEAIQVVTDYFELLAKHDYNQLQQRMRLSSDKLHDLIHLIQSLSPRPGAQISAEEPTNVIPDVVVKKNKMNGHWTVELNLEALPKLRINKYYLAFTQRGESEADVLFLRNQLQEARWFLKSLQSRHETLLKVASCIIEYQRDFLEQGAEAMKPLILREIAEILNLHESTISRVTTQKYIMTPQGVFELKYFFSSHLSSQNGQECSSTAVCALIKKLIATENPKHPLSDNKIAQVLLEQGISVARRTVAKYRESMCIPASNERKCLI